MDVPDGAGVGRGVAEPISRWKVWPEPTLAQQRTEQAEAETLTHSSSARFLIDPSSPSSSSPSPPSSSQSAIPTDPIRSFHARLQIPRL